MRLKLERPKPNYELAEFRQYDFLTVFTTSVKREGLTDVIDKDGIYATWTQAGDHFNITRRFVDSFKYVPASDYNVDQSIASIFAPTWELIGGYFHWKLGSQDVNTPLWAKRQKPLDTDMYTFQYTKLIRERLRENGAEALDFVRGWLRGNAVITLSCECQPNEFCHRRIVADVMLRALAEQIGIPYQYGGEISKVYGDMKRQPKLI